MSLEIGKISFTPGLQVSGNSSHNVENVSNISQSYLWSDTTVEYEYACEIYETNNILSFICQSFANTVVLPFVCQARDRLDDSECDENEVLLMWSQDDADTETYIESDSFYFGTQYCGDFESKNWPI